MGKIFYLIMLTFNPDHTANVGYMGGHMYASPAACMAVEVEFNARAAAAMEVTTEEELPEVEFNCTSFSNIPKVVDVEYVSDESDLFLKVD